MADLGEVSRMCVLCVYAYACMIIEGIPLDTLGMDSLL
jgi:hypothetical protein